MMDVLSKEVRNVCVRVRQNAPLLATVSATRLMYTLIMEMMF